MMPAKAQQINSSAVLNNKLENYFRNTIISQLFVDANLVLIKCSRPAMKQFSLTESEIGSAIIDIKEHFRYPELAEDILEVITHNDILEKEIQTTDNRWYQMNITPYLRLEDDIADGVIITFVEITMRIKDLKDLERTIADHEILLDTISHDIKTPITNLILSIHLLKDASAADANEFKILLPIVENSIKKIQSLVNELTDARKIKHRYMAEAELLSFEQILDDVRLTLSDTILTSDALITSKLNVPYINFSRRKLRSILYNLINNAIKFKSPERKPEIVITTKREKDFIIISVKDNGIGIKPDNYNTVFSKYFRIENKIEGSGIGLYLIKEIVTLSGGKIILKSELHKGSEFKVYLKEE